MSDKPRTCRATKDNGEPCQSPFVQDNGFCAAHDPEADPGEMRRRGRRGGEVTKERMQRHQGLDPDELPELVTHADAKAWLEIVGRAVTTGRLETNAANAAIRAIREWVQAHQGEVYDEKLKEIEEQLAAIQQAQGERSLRSVR